MENGEKQTKSRTKKPYNASRLLSEMKVLHTDKTMSVIHQRLKQNPEKKILSLWKEGAPSRKEIISYVEAVTDKNSEYYIPPKDRIAVSDMDGTLFCETDPTYFDFKLLMYRVLEDEVYRELATEEERTVVKKIQDFINTGEFAEGLEYDAGQAIASTFSGMTVTEFGQYVRQFGELPAPGYDGMKAGEAFYRPMVQILSYLRKNGFSVYVCSGTDRMVVREIVSGVNITPNRVIGTDERLVARDQGDTKDAEYYFDDHDELVLGGEMLNKNLQMSKVSMIAKEIGYQPVLYSGSIYGEQTAFETDDGVWVESHPGYMPYGWVEISFDRVPYIFDPAGESRVDTNRIYFKRNNPIRWQRGYRSDEF